MDTIDKAALPAERGSNHVPLIQLETGRPMPMALRLWLDESFFNHASRIAKQISQANGFTPKHLLGNVAACFAVVEKSLVWGLSPSAVAASTYSTPGGTIGYEGKLVQAVLEASGKFEGGIRFELYGSVVLKFKDGLEKTYRTNDPALTEARKAEGVTITRQYDWDNVKGKFEVRKSKSGNDYVAPTWTQADTKGLGITVSGKIKDEVEPRVLHFDLAQAWPRNSTLWATAPDRQIQYTAVRAFGNVAVPALLMGMPGEDDDYQPIGFEHAKNVTPRKPERTDYDAGKPAAAAETGGATITDVEEFTILTEKGELTFNDPMDAHDAFVDAMKESGTEAQLEGIWSDNAEAMTQLTEAAEGIGSSLRTVHDNCLKKFDDANRQRVAEQERQQQEARANAVAEAGGHVDSETGEVLGEGEGEGEGSQGDGFPGDQGDDSGPQDDASETGNAYGTATTAPTPSHTPAPAPAPAKATEKPAAAAAKPRDDEFFKRAEYIIEPLRDAAGKANWQRWNTWMISAAKDCKNLDEIGKLRDDNATLWKEFEAGGPAYKRSADNLRQQFVDCEKAITKGK
jgi:hypothetical protein